MKNLFLGLKNPIFILFLIEILIFLINYKPGTFFLGWDNLFPEMNFSSNFQRSFFAIWQEYRGLGLLDGMSFAANFVHYLFTYLLSFILPLPLIRYFFFFFMHFLGGVGTYLLTKELMNKRSYAKSASFFASVFYMLNIATVQMFFAPYELFAVHFAFLPFLLYFAYLYLMKRSKKWLILFILFSVFSTPQSHVPTIFIVYGMALFTLLAFNFFYSKDTRKRIVLILIAVFCINSFWGIPYFYSALKNAKTISDSKINFTTTEDVYLKNKEFGNLSNVLLLKGFSLNFIDNQSLSGGGYMMKAWRDQSASLEFQIIGYGIIGVAVLGIIESIKRREKQYYPFLAIISISFFMLGNDIPLISQISNIINNSVPYFFQIFRFVFTKFSIMYVFGIAVFFSLGLQLLFSYFSHGRLMKILFLLIVSLIFFNYTYPIWQGYFLYDGLKIKIPQSYFNMVSYLKTQNYNTRVATLPQPSFWGWTYTSWGYRGSGFFWYGIPQATLDGAFYPWSHENENYFWEITNAIYSRNLEQLNAVLDKYQIGWILLDRSVISFTPERSLFVDQTENLLSQSDHIVLDKQFGNLLLYKVKPLFSFSNFISLENNIPLTEESSTWNNRDKLYEEVGNYIHKATNDIYYPFSSLFTGRRQEDVEFNIAEDSNSYILTSKISKNLLGGQLIIPPLNNDEVSEINPSDLSLNIKRTPLVYLDNELINYQISGDRINLNYIKEGILKIIIPKINGYYSDSFDPASNNDISYSCDAFNNGYNNRRPIKVGLKNLSEFISISSSNCMDLDMPNLTHNLGYLIRINSRYVTGKPMQFSLINKNSQSPDLEVYLPKQTENNTQLTTSYWIQPPMEPYGRGYTLHFDNVSIGRVETINDLGTISVNPIPYRFLMSLKVVSPAFNVQPVTSNIQPSSVVHPNPSYYKVEFNNFTMKQFDNETLMLSQSFDSGWKAYEIQCQNSNFKCQIQEFLPFLFGKEIKDHVLVNNWENGWKIESTTYNLPASPAGGQPTTIVIYYLPQVLEFVGFGFLPFSFIGLFLYRKLRKS